MTRGVWLAPLLLLMGIANALYLGFKPSEKP